MMSVDINIIKARANNEYRLSKVRGEAMISVRIPGGILPAHLLPWRARLLKPRVTVRSI
ncbi:anaerobic sulfite reductase subunit C [Escherichia coli UMEA 3200-1]|nr:anaerobic sulfite reductase subunit C [Escherichia coli UMEA 3200-1]